MSTFDVRTQPVGSINEIIFADRTEGHLIQAHKIEPLANCNGIKMTDGDEYLLVHSKQHADDLRKALDKAEELGWIK